MLNAAYQPVGICTWQEAMTKLHAHNARDRVEIIAHHENKVVRSAHAAHLMPSVVRHVKFRTTKRKGIKFSRDNIWARDRGRCQYCNMQVPRASYTYDHVLPKSRGGKTSWENIVTACAECNGRKKDQTPQEARMKLKTLPIKPDHLPDEFRNCLRFKSGMPSEWLPFFSGYWYGQKEESST